LKLPPRQGVHTRNLDVCLRFERNRSPAELRRHIWRRAVVDHRPTTAEPGAEQTTLAKPGTEVGVEAVEHVAAIRCKGHQILDLTEPCGRHVVESADRISAAAGKPRIG